MPYVRSYIRRGSLTRRRTRVRAHNRRYPRQLSRAYVLVAVAVIIFLLWLILDH
jgi:hypothetical protein